MTRWIPDVRYGVGVAQAQKYAKVVIAHSSR
jgi:hypothetical protein